MKPAMLVAGLLLASAAASAADLAECRSIKDDAVRLFCYDRAAGGDAAPVAAQDAPATRTANPVPGAAAVPPPGTASKPAPPPVPERIESRIVGSFSGWAQGTRFALENGQTWEVVTVARVSVARQDAPRVVIARDFIGQYQLAVDGVKQRVVVRLVDPAP